MAETQPKRALKNDGCLQSSHYSACKDNLLQVKQAIKGKHVDIKAF